MKIYLSPSNQPGNKYICSNTTEKAQMEKMAVSIKDELEKYEKVEVVMATLNMGIENRPSEARSKGCDLYFALHSNAGSTTAKGAVALYHPKQDSMRLFGEYICRRLAEVSPYGTDRKKPVYSGMDAFNGFGFAEIREPYKFAMRALLLEVDFHSNHATCQYLVVSNDNIGRNIGKAIADYYALSKKQVEIPGNTIYRVQTGAFRLKRNAEDLVARLQNDGYDAFIKVEEGL